MPTEESQAGRRDTRPALWNAAEKHRTFERHALARALSAMACGVALCAALPGEASAQPAAAQRARNERQAYSIPAGPLAPALRHLASAANVPLTFTADQTDGKRTAGVQGPYTPREAFAALLAGTDLQAVPLDNGGYVLRGRPASAEPGPTSDAQTLPTIRVTASAEKESAWGPVAGFVASRSATATKTDTAIAETPFSISVVPNEQMDRQGALKTEQALRYEAGVRTELADDLRHQNVQIRGFNIGSSAQGIYLDGLALATRYYGSYDINPYGLERVEILHGPSSVLYGQGVPGGIVNQVSKRPTEVAQREIEITAGTPARGQVAMDLSGPLDQEGQWLYRLTGLVRDADTQVDSVKDERSFLAPSLTWKPNAATSLTLLSNFQTIRAGSTDQWLPSDGTVRETPYGRIPTRFFSGEPAYDHYDKDHAMVGYAFEHRFDDALTFRQNVRYAEIKTDYQALISELGWATDALGRTDYSALQRYTFASKEKADTFAIDNQLQYKLRSGDLAHTLLAGLDYQDSSFDTQLGFDFGSVPPINPFNPIYGYAIARPDNYADTRQTMRQFGVYFQDQMKFRERWVLDLGGRYDSARSTTDDRLKNSTTNDDDHAFTWRLGVGHVFDSGVMPYASYATSFKPQAGTTFGGDAFEPTTGEQTELGIKYQPPGSDQLWTAALFDLKQRNVLTRDALNLGFQVQTGEIRSRGLEFQSKTALTRSLTVIAAYTYNDMAITKSNNVPSDIGLSPFAGVPRHMASVWADYAFREGPLAGLSVGGGARYVGTTTDDGIGKTTAPPFTLFDLSLQYDLGRSSSALKGSTLDLKISNLFDKTYVASCYNANLCFYGPRRVATTSFRYRW